MILRSVSSKTSRSKWSNIGGQLIRSSEVVELKNAVKKGKIKSWDELHDFYILQGKNYEADKLHHAYASLQEILNITSKQFTPEILKSLLDQVIETKSWMSKGIYESRAKDYSNPFRKMVFENNEEMNKVTGKLEDNTFIQSQLKELDEFKKVISDIRKKFKL